MRLTVEVAGEDPWEFDHLWPDLYCHAPGYFTLEMKNRAGALQTHFRTGDEFTVEGAFHWDTDVEAQKHSLRLDVDDGLFERGHEKGYDGVERWHLKATEPGDYALTLTLVESGQTFPAVVSVRRSPEAWLTEIYAAYVYPLDAEIVARLRQIDERFSTPEVNQRSFNILPPEEFIRRVFSSGEAALWLEGLLAAARREQWHNMALLNLILVNIAPTYLPNQGAFVPYAPNLASHLASLHPSSLSERALSSDPNMK